MNAYLQKYAYSHDLNIPSCYFWDKVLIVPCYGENDILKTLELSLEKILSQKTEKFLIVYYINASVNASISYREENFRLWNRIEQHPKIKFQTKTALLIEKNNIDSLFINAFNPPQESQWGVGHARKSATDFVLSLFLKKQIKNEWVIHLDADCQMTENYFEESFESKKYGLGKETVCFLHTYEHQYSNENDIHLKAYDINLKYQEAALKYCGSPYAYTSLGSILEFSLQAYAKVRGFSKVQAGEDFYFLNKLAKVGQIIQKSSKHPDVLIQNRFSSRVPFGTGAMMQKMKDNNISFLKLPYYHPHIYRELKQFIESWVLFCKSKDEGLFQKLLETHSVQKALLDWIDFISLKKQLLERKSESDRIRTFHTYFDAFKTLKAIHFLRDHFFSSVDCHLAYEKCEFKNQWESLIGKALQDFLILIKNTTPCIILK